jgi:protoporphyrin/coproporphyrin ferrochelatase
MEKMKKKIGVVLFNLGGPDELSSVKPFLFNLFNDPAIIGAPSLIRFILAKLISSKREKKAKEIYSFMGGKSPILKETNEQRIELEKMLEKEDSNYKVFISMRYWKPFINETIKDIIKWNPDEVILLPLYPQFSSTTSGSSLNSWKKEIDKNKLEIPTKIICCYPQNEDFILAHVNEIKNIIKKAKNKNRNNKNIRLLFSAHGLPEKIIKKGDPYQYQIEKTVTKVIENLNINEFLYTICYQSKVGPLKWIGPSTEQEIIKSSKNNEIIVLVPIAFVSEHSETLVELDIEYKEIANNNGCDLYFRAPALGKNKYFIKGLYNLITKKNDNKIINKKFCNNDFKNCFYNTFWDKV